MTLSVHEVMFCFDQIDKLFPAEYANSVHPVIVDQSIAILGSSNCCAVNPVAAKQPGISAAATRCAPSGR